MGDADGGNWVFAPDVAARLDPAFEGWSRDHLTAHLERGDILSRCQVLVRQNASGPSYYLNAPIDKSLWDWTRSAIGDAAWTSGISFVGPSAQVGPVQMDLVGIELQWGTILRTLSVDQQASLGLRDHFPDQPGVNPETLAAHAIVGGRPARRHGDAISRITLRIAELPVQEIARYTAEAIGAELAAEYTKLGEMPPHVANLATFGAGILRSLKARDQKLD